MSEITLTKKQIEVLMWQAYGMGTEQIIAIMTDMPTKSIEEIDKEFDRLIFQELKSRKV